MMIDRSRQADLVPEAALANEHPVVVGVGAVGRQVALQLASIGVRRLTLIDFDRVDATNIATQGFAHGQIGLPKVQAVREAAQSIDPTIEVIAIEDRFKPTYLAGQSAFCTVDTIAARSSIWRSVGRRLLFWADARMRGEVLRILTVADFGGREHYPTTLFAQSEAQGGSCTSKSTIYSAAVGAGMLLHQYSRWLRRLPTEPDVTLSLLASELSVGN